MIINGNQLRNGIFSSISQDLKLVSVTPTLEIIQVGDNPSSTIYVNKKIEAARSLGLTAHLNKFEESTTEDDLKQLIGRYNADTGVHGIIVQLPLPTHINMLAVLNAVSPEKDIDGLTFVNQGRLFAGFPGFTPCTPRAVMHMIKSVRTNLAGLRAVVIGRSVIVGRPVSHLLLSENCTLTVAHSKTVGLGDVTKTADILVVAAGAPGLIRKDMVKHGAIILDVGISRVNGHVIGDVAFDEVSDVASAISPVPGGVGPMTVAMLMRNLVDSAMRMSLMK